MNKILVVEDEVNTAELLRRYFEIVGYSVLNAHGGKEAIDMAQQHQPEVIILDIRLPDIDGYEVCKKLRSDEKTSRIPIVFLTTKDERSDRLEGLRLGADDYLSKPFDVEELRLRVHNIIANTGGTPLVDARTSLPNIALMKERLPKLLENTDAVFLDATVEHYEVFRKRYGPVAANQVLRGTAKMISDVLHETGNSKSFIGHPRDEQFLVGATQSVEKVEKALVERFKSSVKQYYDYADQERGSMLDGERELPFMALKVSRLTPKALRALVRGDNDG
jgi:DNA-binding response OmpR family regulator